MFHLLTLLLTSPLYCVLQFSCIQSMVRAHVGQKLQRSLTDNRCIFFCLPSFFFFFFFPPDKADDELEMTTVCHRPEGLEQLEAQTNFTKQELQILYRGFKNVITHSLIRILWCTVRAFLIFKLWITLIPKENIYPFTPNGIQVISVWTRLRVYSHASRSMRSMYLKPAVPWMLMQAFPTSAILDREVRQHHADKPHSELH